MKAAVAGRRRRPVSSLSVLVIRTATRRHRGAELFVNRRRAEQDAELW